MRCPGQDMSNWTGEVVREIPCPACGVDVEFFKDEGSRRCPGCGHRFGNPAMDLGCAKWCEHAKECLGFVPERGEPAASQGEGPLASVLIGEMKAVFGRDQKRIRHALAVFQHARALVRAESRRQENSGEKGADPRVVLAAAILHDIGILEAERKYGSSAGRNQELAGPPIAKKIMEDVGLDAATIEHVCRIVGSHHTAGDIDTPEFRVVWDADRLVNMSEERDGLGERDLQGFRTESGGARARELFMRPSTN